MLQESKINPVRRLPTESNKEAKELAISNKGTSNGVKLKGCKNQKNLITADHGCDPTTPSTDHSREYVPLIVYGKKLKHGKSLGTRKTFADVGQTIAEVFNTCPVMSLNGISRIKNGVSFLKAVTFAGAGL